MSDERKPNLITPMFRGSYCNLITPRVPGKKGAAQEGKDPKYSILIVLPKDDPDTDKFLKRLRVAIDEATTEKFGKPVAHQKLKHFPIRDGDADDNEDFAGHWLIPASSKFKPGALDSKGQKLFSEDQLYSGAWYRAAISVWAWDSDLGGRGVSVNLHNVLKEKDDTRFGGGTAAEDDFKAHIREDDDEEDEEDEKPAPKKGKPSRGRNDF